MPAKKRNSEGNVKKRASLPWMPAGAPKHKMGEVTEVEKREAKEREEVESPGARARRAKSSPALKRAWGQQNQQELGRDGAAREVQDEQQPQQEAQEGESRPNPLEASQPQLSRASEPKEGTQELRRRSSSFMKLEHRWYTGLFWCSLDWRGLWDSFFCSYCQIGFQQGVLQTGTRFPDWQLVWVSCCVDMVFLHGGALMCLLCATRRRLLEEFEIEEHCCKTCSSVFFCPCCAIAQQHREMTFRGKFPGGVCVTLPSVHVPHPETMPAAQPLPPPSIPGPKLVEGLTPAWQTHLCSCCAEPAICVESLCCPHCQIGRQQNMLTKGEAGMHWECVRTLLLDFISCGLCLVCYNVEQRNLMAINYGIRDDVGCLVNGCCKTLWCVPCAIAQQHREMIIRGQNPGGCCSRAKCNTSQNEQQCATESNSAAAIIPETHPAADQNTLNEIM